MSGHNALQPEGVDSTSDRLDSILDALAALGDSSRTAPTPSVPESTTSATVHRLRAVPDLEDAPEEVAAPVDVEQTVNQANDLASWASTTATVSTPALVPPDLPAPVAAPTQEVDESAFLIEDAPTTMPFEPDAVVEMADPVETVTALAPTEPVPAEPAPIEAVELAPVEPVVEPAPIEAVEPVVEEPVVSASIFAPAPAAPEPVAPESVVFEPVAFEPVALEPVVEAPTEPAIEAATTTTSIFADQPVPTEPDVEQTVGAEADAIVSMLEETPADTVSMLEETPVEETSATTQSIFGTTDANEAPDPAPSLAVVPPVPDSDEDEWVSHDTPAKLDSPTPEAPADLFGALAAAPAEAAPLDGDALWHVDRIDTTPSQTETPAQDEASETVDLGAALWADEPTESTENTDSVVDFFAHDAFEDTPLAEPTAIGSFESDDDLPIPDFTGVYDQTPETKDWSLDETAEGTMPVAEGEASVTAATARRAELDLLRPQEETRAEPAPKADDDSGVALVKEKKSRESSGNSVMIVLCGLVILTFGFVFMSDPGFLSGIEDLMAQFRD